MNPTEFDNQKHADVLLDVLSILSGPLMLCEGLVGVNNQIDDRQFINAAAGAFILMEKVLGDVYKVISKAEDDFIASHKLSRRGN